MQHSLSVYFNSEQLHGVSASMMLYVCVMNLYAVLTVLTLCFSYVSILFIWVDTHDTYAIQDMLQQEQVATANRLVLSARRSRHACEHRGSLTTVSAPGLYLACSAPAASTNHRTNDLLRNRTHTPSWRLNEDHRIICHISSPVKRQTVQIRSLGCASSHTTGQQFSGVGVI